VGSKRVIPRVAANLDADAAFEYYLAHAGPDVAENFMDALETAYGHIARHPGTGSSRYSRQLNIPGLRLWPLSPYPCLVFYLDMPQEIDVLRVLHGSMDIPAWLDP
jgi:toxin ParE1/3/4